MPKRETSPKCDETCPGAIGSFRTRTSRKESNCSNICHFECRPKSNSILSKSAQGKKKWIVCFRGIFAKNKFNQSSHQQEYANNIPAFKTEGRSSDCSCCKCLKNNALEDEENVIEKEPNMAEEKYMEEYEQNLTEDEQNMVENELNTIEDEQNMVEDEQNTPDELSTLEDEKHTPEDENYLPENKPTGKRELCNCPDKTKCSKECRQSINADQLIEEINLCDCLDKTRCAEECQPLNTDKLEKPSPSLISPVKLSEHIAESEFSQPDKPIDLSPLIPIPSSKIKPVWKGSKMYSSQCAYKNLPSKTPTLSEVNKNKTLNMTVSSIRPTECSNMFLPPACLRLTADVSTELPVISEEETIQTEPLIDAPNENIENQNNEVKVQEEKQPDADDDLMNSNSPVYSICSACSRELRANLSNDSNCSCYAGSIDLDYSTVCPSESPKFPIFSAEQKPESSIPPTCKGLSTKYTLDMSDVPIIVCATKRYTLDCSSACPLSPKLAGSSKNKKLQGLRSNASKRLNEPIESYEHLLTDTTVTEKPSQVLTQDKPSIVNFPAGDLNSMKISMIPIKKSRCICSTCLLKTEGNGKVTIKCPKRSTEVACSKRIKSKDLLQPKKESIPKKSLSITSREISTITESQIITREISTVISDNDFDQENATPITPDRTNSVEFEEKSIGDIPSSISESRLNSSADQCSCEDINMNKNQDTSNRFQRFSQRPLCCFCNQPVQKCICESNKQDSDWNSEKNVRLSTLWEKYKCTICNKPILECKCKPSIFDQAMKHKVSPKCSICNEPCQDCKCNQTSDFSVNNNQSHDKTKYSYYNCNKSVEEEPSASKQINCESDNSVEDLDCSCESTQANLKECFGRSQRCPLSTFSKRPLAKCVECLKPLQDCTCQPSENILEVNDSVVDDISPNASKQNPYNKLSACNCETQIYESNLDKNPPIYSKYKCKTCHREVQDCNCSINTYKSDCTFPDLPKSTLNENTTSYTDEQSSVYIYSSQTKCPGCNKPLQDCTCKPDLNQDNSRICPYSKYEYAKSKQILENSGKKSQQSSVKCIRSFSRDDSSVAKPKPKCLRCRKTVISNASDAKSTCRAAAIAQRQRSEDSADSRKNEVCPTCKILLKDCTCSDNTYKEVTPNPESFLKPAFTRYKCVGCDMPLLECKCSPSDAPSVVLDSRKLSTISKPTDSKVEVTASSKEDEREITYCSDQNIKKKLKQDCTCKINKFAPIKPSMNYKCSECCKPLQQCKCKETSESTSDLECPNYNELIKQYQSDINKKNINQEKYPCSDCKQPIQRCKCKQDTEDTILYHASRKCDCSKFKDSEKENYQTNSNPKYQICDSCDRPIDECICKPSNYNANKRPQSYKQTNSIYSTSEEKSPNSSLCIKCATSVNKINKSFYSAVSESQSLKSNTSKKLNEACTYKISSKTNCKPKDYPQFPHPSLLAEYCSDTCEIKLKDNNCPILTECDQIILDPFKFSSTSPVGKKFDLYNANPQSSKDEFTECPPIFIKLCPTAPKVTSKSSVSRIKKYSSRMRNCISRVASKKSFKEKNVRRRSPLNLTRENREKDNRRLYKRKSCKRCNQLIPEEQSIESSNFGCSSIRKECNDCNSPYQINKNYKFN